MAPARLLTFSAEQPVEPGHYCRDGFEPPFTIDVPDGWFAVQDVPGFLISNARSGRSTSSPSSSPDRPT